MSTKKMKELRSQGKTYQQIADELGCCKSNVCYHLSPGQKQNYQKRQLKHRLNQHPMVRKIENFSQCRQYKQKAKTNRTARKLIQDKINTFHYKASNMQYTKPTFTVDDVLQKFGDNPKCYLTGDEIDLNRPRTYQFDHIIPRSRGGNNDIDNLGICTKVANQSKYDMTVDEYLNHCKKVLEYHNLI